MALLKIGILKGQHLYFRIEGRPALDEVYAEAKGQKLTVMDVKPVQQGYILKTMAPRETIDIPAQP